RRGREQEALTSDRARHPTSSDEDHRRLQEPVAPEESVRELLDAHTLLQGPADGGAPARLVRVERRAIEEMVCGRQARDPTRDHRHVVPAAVRRHDHARRIPDEHRIVLHRSRRRPHHRHEPTGRLTGLQAPRPSEPITTFPWNVPWFVATSSPWTRTTVVSVMISAPSSTACAAIP